MSNPEFAKLTGLSSVYIWQLAQGRRTTIDSKAARKVEESAGLETGWMDTDHEAIEQVRAAAKWPFPAVDPRDYFNLLDVALRNEIEDRLVGAIARLKAKTAASFADQVQQDLVLSDKLDPKQEINNALSQLGVKSGTSGLSKNKATRKRAGRSNPPT